MADFDFSAYDETPVPDEILFADINFPDSPSAQVSPLLQNSGHKDHDTTSKEQAGAASSEIHVDVSFVELPELGPVEDFIDELSTDPHAFQVNDRAALGCRITETRPGDGQSHVSRCSSPNAMVDVAGLDIRRQQLPLQSAAQMIQYPPRFPPNQIQARTVASFPLRPFSDSTHLHDDIHQDPNMHTENVGSSGSFIAFRQDDSVLTVAKRRPRTITGKQPVGKRKRLEQQLDKGLLCFSLDLYHEVGKRPRTEEQKQNRQFVIDAGGSCLRCNIKKLSVCSNPVLVFLDLLELAQCSRDRPCQQCRVALQKSTVPTDGLQDLCHKPFMFADMLSFELIGMLNPVQITYNEAC